MNLIIIFMLLLYKILIAAFFVRIFCNIMRALYKGNKMLYNKNKVVSCGVAVKSACQKKLAASDYSIKSEDCF